MNSTHLYGVIFAILILAIVTDLWRAYRHLHQLADKDADIQILKDKLRQSEHANAEAFDKGRIQGIADSVIAGTLLLPRER